MRDPFRAGFYLLSNLISRREIHAKQDSTLGGDAPLIPKPKQNEMLATGTLE